MESIDFVFDYLSRSITTKKILLEDPSQLACIAKVADRLTEVYRSGGKLLIAGNGGSAADAQHIAAELVSRFFFDRPGLSAIALTTDTSMLTAIGNDYGFQHLFSRQIEAQGNENDMFIGISTSGNSENIINGIQAAAAKKMITVALCGDGGKIADMVEHTIRAPSSSTPFIQECHISIGHIICALVEQAMFGRAE